MIAQPGTLKRLLLAIDRVWTQQKLHQEYFLSSCGIGFPIPFCMGAPDLLKNALLKLNEVVLDKNHEIQLAVCCLVADGHLLIEDIPGVGKTTLVKSLAKIFSFDFSRIQFTNDLLPADIIGNSIFNQASGRFEFHKGPIFAQLVLGDELNRATPKTQSACLQAMEERFVSVDGLSHALPKPFYFIATQNPRQQIGTFPLPESQLDRFLMRLSLGYPSRAAERRLLNESMNLSRAEAIERLTGALSPADLLEAIAAAKAVRISEAIVNYVQDLVDASRHLPDVGGLSTRATLGLMRAAQAWAYLSGRAFVLPEDVQAVAVPVMNHRLNPIEDVTGETGIKLAQDILASTRVD